MAPTLTFHLLSLVLFFFTNGQGIGARGLKTKLQDQKQFDLNGDINNTEVHETSQANDLDQLLVSGGHGDKQSKDPNQLFYLGVHETNSKDLEDKQSKDLNPLFVWGGHQDKQPKDPNPLSGWGGHQDPKDPNPLFLWGGHQDKQPKDPNPLFVWGGHQDPKDPNPLFLWGGHQDKQLKDPNPLFVWGGHQDPKDPNPLFLWGGHQDKQPKDPNPLSVWGGHQDPKDPNPLFVWGGHQDKQPKDPNPLFVWGGHQDKQPKDPNPLFVWGGHQDPKDPNPLLVWGGHQDKQPKDPNPLFVWGIHETNSKDLNDKHPEDPNQLLFWGGHGNKQPMDPNQLLVWGGHEDKQPRDLKQLLIRSGQEAKSKDLEDHPSSNLDHTEAFKKGFFTLDDLHVGNVMTLQFPVQQVPHLLSKKEADSIPFSLSQLASVLHHLSIPEDSPQAKSMRKTLEHCEAVKVNGETRMCVNSVESMLEFVDTIIGSKSKQYDILTTSNPSPSATPLQKYTILEVSHDINAPKWVSCHPMPYPYAVYGCHHIATGSKVFKVSLVGDENGDKMEALGMCHLDTSDWNPDHILFKTLGIKPGKNSSACHFFPVNHLLWVPLQPSKSTM